MRIILQRASIGTVRVEGEIVGEIRRGIVALVGFGRGDTALLLAPMADKMLHMRIFPNEQGKFDRSLLDIGGGLLLVPQFTLYADLGKGRRPDFSGALSPDEATLLFDSFTESCRERLPGKVATGRFGAHMQVTLENDGPVTIILDSELHLR